jgi:hypothetical protein
VVVNSGYREGKIDKSLDPDEGNRGDKMREDKEKKPGPFVSM